MHRFAELGTIGSPRWILDILTISSMGSYRLNHNQHKGPYEQQELAQIP